MSNLWENILTFSSKKPEGDKGYSNSFNALMTAIESPSRIARIMPNLLAKTKVVAAAIASISVAL